jgi:hypothetical protein
MNATLTPPEIPGTKYTVFDKVFGKKDSVMKETALMSRQC